MRRKRARVSWLRVGERVEVIMHEEGFRGSCYTGRIITLGGSEHEVEFDELIDDKCLREIRTLALHGRDAREIDESRGVQAGSHTPLPSQRRDEEASRVDVRDAPPSDPADRAAVILQPAAPGQRGRGVELHRNLRPHTDLSPYAHRAQVWNRDGWWEVRLLSVSAARRTSGALYKVQSEHALVEPMTHTVLYILLACVGEVRARVC